MPLHKVETPSSQSLSRVPSISKLTNESLGKLTNRRDVVLINPICGGSGDISLANKIANLALEQDCRITIVPVDCTLFGDPTFNNNHRNISHCSVEHSIGDFYDPIFVVAPAAICSPAKLHDIIESLCHEYHLNKDDVACIEEMDFISPDNARVLEREDMFKKSGFNKSMYYSLGFSEGAIGYLPVDKHTVDIVRERCERDLVNLLDSYNFSLEKQSRYNIAYISSPNIYNAVRVFVTNTLSENQSGNANYIIVVRLLNEKNEDKLIKYTEGVLSHGGDDYNPQDLFSSANIYVAKPDDAEKQTIHHKVNVDGEGGGRINIVFVNSLPQNILYDFMALADSGMASGDQSLGEFLSLNGQVPYYEVQPWKVNLGNALVAHAKDIGGDELSGVISSRIVGINDHILTSVERNRATEQSDGLKDFNERIRSRTADSQISELFKPNRKDDEDLIN